MPNILPYFETARRPLTDKDLAILEENYAIGFTAAAFLEEDKSYVRSLRDHMDWQMQEYGKLSVRAFAGYSIGLRRGRFAQLREDTMPWDEISAYALGDFSQGHAYGSQYATDPDSALSIDNLIVSTLESFGEGSLPIKTDNALLGHIAGIHSVALRLVPTT